MPNINGHPIDHVVVLMLENRGFDHFMGWLYERAQPPLNWYPQQNYTVDWWGQPEDIPDFLGLDWVDLARLTNSYVVDGETLLSQRPVRGAHSPIVPSVGPHEDFVYIMAQMYNLEPARMASRADRNDLIKDGGGYRRAPQTGYIQDYAREVMAKLGIQDPRSQRLLALLPEIMEMYTPDQIPVLSSLARHYAVSDLWFCSVPSQTNTNRAFWMSGSARGEVKNDFYDNYPDAWIRWSADGLPRDTFSLFEMLTRFNVDWAYYWQQPWPPVPGRDSLREADRQYARTMFPALRGSAFDRNFPKLEQFYRDARDGALPAVTYIEPHFGGAVTWDAQKRIQGNEYHPVADVTAPEFFVKQVYDAVSQGPKWPQTLFIITFDENGGTYDHVAPPKAMPPGPMFDRVPYGVTAPESSNQVLAQKKMRRDSLDELDEATRTQYGFPFDMFGIRVPTLLISPWIPRGTIFRSPTRIPFDHTSILATILKWQGLSEYAGYLGNRTASAPTFDGVLSAPAARPHDDASSGIVLQPRANVVPLHSGATLQLRYRGTNRRAPYAGPAWLGGPVVSGSIGGYGGYWYPVLADSPARALTLAIGGTDQTITNGMKVWFSVTDAPDDQRAQQRFLTASNWSKVIADTVWLSESAAKGSEWRIWLRDNRSEGVPIAAGDQVMLLSELYLPEKLTIAQGVFIHDPYQRLALDDSSEDSNGPRFIKVRAGEWAFWELNVV